MDLRTLPRLLGEQLVPRGYDTIVNARHFAARHELPGSLPQHVAAYRRAVEYAERAKKPLYAFPPSSERDALLALPDYVLSRDR